MKPYPATVCCLSALLAIAVSPLHAAEKGEDFRTDVFVGQQDGYHTYRIPAMVITAKGTVLLFCEGRKNRWRDWGDIDQLLKRSEDGGRTWSKQVVIHDEGRVGAGNPCCIVERDGKTVHLLFTATANGLCYTKSTDDGQTWSPMVVTSDVPTDKGYSEKSFLKGFGGSPVEIAVGPVHGIHTSKGRLVAPCYMNRTVESKRRWGSGIISSDDGGKTWVAGGLIPYLPDFSPGECTVVERSDGSLLMNMRAGGPDGAYAFGYRVVSTSSDAGITWSIPVVDKNLPCPACQGSMIRLNEKEILFLNPAVHRAGGFHRWSRRNLTLRLSGDDGRTWPHALVLNEGPASYSDMAVTKEGKILCVFENGNQNFYQKISVVQVDRASLVAGKDAQAEKAAETQLKVPEVSEAAKVKVKAHFAPLFKEFGRNNTTKVEIVSGPKEVKMLNGGVAGKQWIATSGKYRFKLTIQDSTGVKLDQLVERLQKLPGPYMKACTVVSDEGEDGIAIYANLGGAAAHGGQGYINIVPNADALVIAHESGHTLEQFARASDPKILDKWDEAIQADKISISDYGDHVRHEDLAEFAMMHAVCLGAGPEHLTALKNLSPARFALWEKILQWPDRN